MHSDRFDITPVSIIISTATETRSHCHPAGPAGFPGGAPPGMPGLGDLLKDPELLNAMKVTYTAQHQPFSSLHCHVLRI